MPTWKSARPTRSRLAGIIRRTRPAVHPRPHLRNRTQHPDHGRLGTLVRDATRLARYGGVAELRELEPHAADLLLFYALGAGAEPAASRPVLIDVSAPEIVTMWTAAMEAHASQMKTRNYVEYQLARARTLGLSAGLDYAQPVWPNDPLVFDSLAMLGGAARKF